MFTYLLFTPTDAVALDSSCLVVAGAHVVLCVVDVADRVLLLAGNLVATLHQLGFALLLGLVNLCLCIPFRIGMLQGLLAWYGCLVLYDACLGLSSHSLVLLWADALLLHEWNRRLIILHLHLSLSIHCTNFEMLGSIVGVGGCHVVLLLVSIHLLVLSLMIDWFYFVLIKFLLLCLCPFSGSHAMYLLIVIDLHLMWQLWFNQIHLWSELCCLFQRSFIFARVAWVLTAFHDGLFGTFASCKLWILWLHLTSEALSCFLSTLRSQCCIELIRVAMTSNKRCLLVSVYLSIALYNKVCLYSIKIITLSTVMLRRHVVVFILVDLVCDFTLVVAWFVLHLVFQIHNHLLLLVV